MKPLEVVLVGAGGRGIDAFGAFALKHPEYMKFVGVAEPREERRRHFAQQHGIPEERQFASWAELFARPKMAEACVNATMDQDHLPSAVPALEAGYDLFLEKPMADTAEGCREIVRAAERTGRAVMICTPLRFTPFYSRVKEQLAAGAIGRPLAVSMVENVASWHFAHSFVRGNWGVVEKSGPLILTKCCHDMDLVCWLMDSTPVRVNSNGDRLLFHAGNAPEGAPARCTDGCPVGETCPFNAEKLYGGEFSEWPVSVISFDRSQEARRAALRTGPYGRCVFLCDNTAVDEHLVSGTFANGVLFDFAVRAHTVYPFRTIRVLGSEGELNGHAEKGDIRIQRFQAANWQDPEATTITINQDECGSHMGGDAAGLKHFVECLRKGDRATLARGLRIALEGHLLSFAAEEARAAARTVDFAEFNTPL